MDIITNDLVTLVAQLTGDTKTLKTSKGDLQGFAVKGGGFLGKNSKGEPWLQFPMLWVSGVKINTYEAKQVVHISAPNRVAQYLLGLIDPKDPKALKPRQVHMTGKLQQVDWDNAHGDDDLHHDTWFEELHGFEIVELGDSRWVEIGSSKRGVMTVEEAKGFGEAAPDYTPFADEFAQLTPAQKRVAMRTQRAKTVAREAAEREAKRATKVGTQGAQDGANGVIVPDAE